MSRRIGSWWIKDGIDGRRIEAQGFPETLELISGFSWTQDRGQSELVEKDFIQTSGYTEKSDQVDALMMSTHGWTDGFLTWDGSVTTTDDIDFGQNDLEIFATHACDLLEHTSTNSVGRWIPAFERLHYMFGFHNSSYSGSGQDPRGEYFATYAALLYYLFPGFGFSYTLREAWACANILVESSDVQWAYLRCNGNSSDGAWVSTYAEKLRTDEPSDPRTDREFWTNRGSC